MKRLILLIIFGLTVGSLAYAGDQLVLARITVYWRGEGQLRACWKGVRLRDGHCAVDPKKIPYGSKVSFGDTTCVAVDTGPAVVSRKAARSCGRTGSERNAVVIDRFFESKRQAMSWVKTHPHFMIVRIQTPAARARVAAKDPDHAPSMTHNPNAPTFALWKSVPPEVGTSSLDAYV